MWRNLIFSIIITTFNNIDTIRKTLDSIIHQTLNNDKYEIIVIDDKSVDGTWEILNTYNKSNLKVYQLDENSGGPSKPRNKGIRESIGDYVYFLDGDDWLDLNVLETISLNYLHLDSDIIISKVIKDNDGKQSIHAKFMTIKENHNVNGNGIPYLYYYLGPSGKFIKRELILKSNILFPHNLHFGEDKVFFMNVFSVANSVTTIPTISTYINRSPNNISLVKKSNFLTKRNSDYFLFKNTLDVTDPKFRNKFLLRILEYDLLNNCNSKTFLNLEYEEQEKVFYIIRKMFTHESITSEMISSIDPKFSNAIKAIYDNNLDSFIGFFKWYKEGLKIISKKENNLYSYISTNNEFETIVPFCNIKNLQVDRNSVYLQVEINNLKQEQISGIQLESRTHFMNSKFISEISINHNLLTLCIDKSLLDSLDKGIYNVLVIYDSYKALNIKYGFTKKLETTNRKVTFYPTINGNLSVKLET